MLSALPIVDSPPGAPPPVAPVHPLRAIAVQAVRVGVLIAIVLLLYRKHQERVQSRETDAVLVAIDIAQSVFPQAAAVSLEASGATAAVDAAGQPVGRLWQTSPQADRIIGFSGPTNVLLGFGVDDRLAAIRILSSRDTVEHANQVADDPRFLPSFLGLTPQEIQNRSAVDGVSGATLTSLAIAESIRHRLGGRVESLRFPEEVSLDTARTLFPGAELIERDQDRPSLWRVFDAQHQVLGELVRGSPAIDNLVGYQGPTDLLIAVAPQPNPPSAGIAAQAQQQVTGVLVGRSYDNEPYVGYVREDRYFFKVFRDKTLEDLAELDLRAARVEGVSGATMTSLAVADGVVATARQWREDERRLAARRETARLSLSPRDWGTMVVTGLGVGLGLSRWRANRWLRWPWLLVLVGYLGFINGDLISQALLAGWSRNGVPWRKMLGPVVLTAAALLVPLLAGRNVYCSHLCPHGALQQLLMHRLPWRIRLGRMPHRLLAMVPAALLLWVVVVAATDLEFSLVDIEPFDAYVPAIAGAATLTLFAVSLLASAVVPMAYCQYGCPTGALLGWLRRHSRSDRLGWGDLAALAGLLLSYWL